MQSGSAADVAARRSPQGALALLACVTAGGCAALSWEVLWQIRSALALGVSARGTAITLATTMAGMGAGALLAGRWLGRRPARRPLRLYGWLEAAIGLAGLALPLGFGALELLDARVARAAPALAPGLHALGIVALLGVPTLAMGASVPVFSGVARRFDVPLSRLYAANTAGAALGVLAFTFWVVPALGLTRTGWAVAALNGLVWVATRAFPEPAAAAAEEEAPPPEADPTVRPVAVTLAALTGFATFGLEVAWFRSMRATFQTSTDTFAILLASVLVPLALGARLAPRLRARGIGPGVLLGLTAVAILAVTPLIERMDWLSAWIPDSAPGRGGYVVEQLGRLALSLALLGPPILCLGTVLPWLLDDTPAARDAGRLYGANTLGAACGSLCAAWILLPGLGFARSAWGLGALVLVGALAVIAPERRLRVAAAGAAALALAVAASSSIGRDRIQTRYDWPSHRILSYAEGPDSTVSVVEHEGARYLMIDGFAASGEHTDWGPYMDRMGRLPMLVHPDPEAALVIGFGTGQTAHGARDEDPVRLDVAELDAAVLEAAPFFETNRGVLDDPRVEAHVMDGRAWLRRSQRRYDVITLEPMPPHFAGVNALYSRDFYEILARRLEPGGIVCQWVPLHLLPPYYAASVARTFQSVFPDAELWVLPHAQGILLGRAPSVQPAGAAPRLSLRRADPALREETALRLGPRALTRYGSEGDVITDDNQRLAYGRLPAEIRLYRTQQGVIRRNLERVRRLAAAKLDAR